MRLEPVFEEADGSAIRVWLVPGSTRPGIEGLYGDKIRIRVGARPQDGRANREAAELLARVLGVPVTLGSGMTSRSKVFHAAGLSVDESRALLGLSGH